jgi:transposase InsO family protein
MAIQRVRTDNGNEFGTDFIWHLRDVGIAHRHTPGCPGVNGKVERSHRTDGEEFYRRTTFRTPGELAAKVRRSEHAYKHRRSHLVLAGKTHAERVCGLKITERSVQAAA